MTMQATRYNNDIAKQGPGAGARLVRDLGLCVSGRVVALFDNRIGETD